MLIDVIRPFKTYSARIVQPRFTTTLHMLGASWVLRICIDMYLKQENTSSVNTRSENGYKEQKRKVYNEEIGGISKGIKSF